MSVTFTARSAAGRVPMHDQWLNWHQGGAAATLKALGLLRGETRSGDPDLWGSCTIGDARRAILYALTTLPVRVDFLELPARESDRHHVGGVDEAGIRRRIDDFATFVDVAAERGATEIHWG